MQKIKYFIVIFLGLFQTLMASDRITLNDDIEQECRFIRFFETQNGQYVEIQIENRISGIPLNQVEKVVSEDGTIIFQDGVIQTDEPVIQEIIPGKIEKVMVGNFPYAVQNVFPQGIYLLLSIIDTDGKSMTCPRIGFVKNSSHKPRYFGLGVSYYKDDEYDMIQPSFLFGIKGSKSANLTFWSSGFLNVEDYKSIRNMNRYLVSSDLTLSFLVRKNILFSTKYGCGTVFGKLKPIPNIYLNNEFSFELEKTEVFIKPSVEFGLDIRNNVMTNAFIMSLVF